MWVPFASINPKIIGVFLGPVYVGFKLKSIDSKWTF